MRKENGNCGSFRQCENAIKSCRTGRNFKLRVQGDPVLARVEELIEHFLRPSLRQVKRKILLYLLADGRREFLENLMVDFLLHGQPAAIAAGVPDKPFDMTG